MTVFFIPKNSDSTSGNLWQFSSRPFFKSTHIPMFTVLDPLLEFTYHLLFSWRKFAICIQSLLCMLFLFGWPPCQRSDMTLMEVSQHAYDMIHYISGLFGYFYVGEIYVNLIWYLYLFVLNEFFSESESESELLAFGGFQCHKGPALWSSHIFVS